MNVEITEKRRENGLLSIFLEGEITYVNSNGVKNQIRSLMDEEIKMLVLDLGGVPFMDSAGIGVIVSLLKEMHVRGGKIALAGIQPNVGKVFWITKLDKVLPIYETREEAESAMHVSTVNNGFINLSTN
ncbi:MAG TPA: STAS domain-containing protein [Clostridia bacterium]|jgi:anti-anti-sigma factor|nr:STAS domain-containing protein [Clostridia bacterium]